MDSIGLKEATTRVSPTVLEKYLADRQADAMHLQALLAVLDHLDNEDACPDEQTSLIFIAQKLARDLNEALDSVSLPEVTA